MLKYNNIITVLFIQLILFDWLSSGWCQKCQVPEIDPKKIEVICFNWDEVTAGEIANYDGSRKTTSKFSLLAEPCVKSAKAILVRCKIGYQNRNWKKEDALLNICKDGDWLHETNDSDDCVPICGKLYVNHSRPTSIPLLYKGNETDIQFAPWHVAVYRNSSNNFEQICGGTIVHSNIVISAGHCFYDESFSKTYDPLNFWIGAGKRFRQYEADERLSQFSHVKEIHLPPTFQSQPLRSDIAVLVLDRHFEYTPGAIAPVCLDSLDLTQIQPNYNQISGTLYGWGDTSFKGLPSSKLLKIDLVTIENNECRKLIDPNHRSDISADRFCAINENNATACGGDSGGGLITFQKVYKLTGIVSAGLDRSRYCSDGFVTLFTRLTVFQDFLKVIISKSRNEDQDVIRQFHGLVYRTGHRLIDPY